MDASQPRVVLAHDWLTGMRGGEKCLEALCQRWPQSELFTLLHKKGAVSADIENLSIHTSLLNRLPSVQSYYRYLLPLMPWTVRRWSIPQCDLVVSFSHCVAKSVKPPENVPHVCYCFTPMRYAWQMREAYFGSDKKGGLKARMIRWLLGRIRDWDQATADHVSHFIAISKTIQDRIQSCYGRDSVVIYPPVDTNFYHPADVRREDYYLVVSAFAPYKRLDLAVEACRKSGRRLVVIGTGQDEKRLRSLADDHVEFLGWQSNEVIRDHFRRCRALIFPGFEDFGIVPVEAMGCGAPVIAFGQGGATETVIPRGARADATGIWFEDQNVDCLISGLDEMDASVSEFSAEAARRQAVRFNLDRYRRELFAYLDSVMTTETQRAAA